MPSSERAVVVTGGRQGVGRGIVQRLAADGLHVVVLDRAAPMEAWPADVAALDDPARVVAAITANVTMAVVGCSVAVGRFRASGTTGSVVNVSSHQAQRAVRGALPYATAKAAIEGLTCADPAER